MNQLIWVMGHKRWIYAQYERSRELREIMKRNDTASGSYHFLILSNERILFSCMVDSIQSMDSILHLRSPHSFDSLMVVMVWIIYRSETSDLRTLGSRMTPCKGKYYWNWYWMLFWSSTHGLLSRDSWILASQSKSSLQGTRTLENKKRYIELYFSIKGYNWICYSLYLPMKYLLLIVAIITIGFTSLVNIPGSPYLIAGMSQADISNMFSTSVTPEGNYFCYLVHYLSLLDSCGIDSLMTSSDFYHEEIFPITCSISHRYSYKNECYYSIYTCNWTHWNMAYSMGKYLYWYSVVRDVHDSWSFDIYIFSYTKNKYHRKIKCWDYIRMDYHGNCTQYHGLDSIYVIYSRIS